MKYLVTLALMLCFSMNAFAWGNTHSSWSGSHSTWQKPQKNCPAKPVTIQTACDLKSYAASAVGSSAFSFFQGYVVSAFRTLKYPVLSCSYVGTDQAAVAAAIAYLNKVSAQQCAAITAANAMQNAFEAAGLVSCVGAD